MKSTTRTLLFAAIALLACAAYAFPEAAHAVVAMAGPEALAGMAFMGSTATTIVKDAAYTGTTPVNTQPDDADADWLAIPITFPAAAPVANDIHALCKLLPGVKVADWFIDLDDVDSDVSAAASLSLGELKADLTDMAVIYKNAIVIGQTGGVLRMAAASAAAGLRALMAATLNTERVIGLKWDTAAATYATGKKGMLYLLAHY